MSSSTEMTVVMTSGAAQPNGSAESNTPPPPSPPPPPPPLPVFEPAASPEERLARIREARNPFLEAASYLLRALADIPRLTLDAQGVSGLRVVMEEETKTFTRLCDQANLRRDHMLAVRYALCTAIDEAANLTEWGGGQGKDSGPWPAHALLQTFHQEGDGGNKVFLLIGRLAASPKEHHQVLEVMLHVLGLGFEGHYRTQTERHRMVESIRNRLHQIVMGGREPIARDLSPNWRGVAAGKFGLLRGVPVWVTASVFALALLGMFSWYRYQLAGRTEALDARIRALGNEVRFRPVQAPRHPRLKELLADEVAAGRVDVDEDDRRSRVVFKGDDMFSTGRAAVSAAAMPMLEKVAQGINEVAGAVEVTGHSDNQRIATREFPDNKTLSQRRAEKVADVLRGKGVDPARITTSGAGDSQPVADNATAAGRARNRRVEIAVRSD